MKIPLWRVTVRGTNAGVYVAAKTRGQAQGIAFRQGGGKEAGFAWKHLRTVRARGATAEVEAPRIVADHHAAALVVAGKEGRTGGVR